MIVDFHTHIFPERVAILAIKNLSNTINAKPFFNGTIDDLRDNMLKNGIDISVCMPIVTNPRHTKTINDYAIMVNNKYDNVYSFGGIHPDYLEYKDELNRLKENGIKGIKLHPVYQQTNIDDKKFIDIINYAISIGLYVLIHAGLDPGFPGAMESSVDKIVNMLDRIDDSSKIILAHFGGLFEWDKVLNEIAGRNVYLDTAMTFGKLYKNDGSYLNGIDDELLYKIIKKHGCSRIIAGSDNPWTPSNKLIDYVNALDISKEEKEKILWKNAYNILNLR